MKVCGRVCRLARRGRFPTGAVVFFDKALGFKRVVHILASGFSNPPHIGQRVEVDFSGPWTARPL